MDADVLIVGLGPVGSCLATILGQAGLRVLAVDRAEAGYHLPRAVVFDDEIMRLFQGLGLAGEMTAITEPGTGAIFLDADERVLVRWERPLEPSILGWQVNRRFHQPELEDVLRGAASRCGGVSILWQHDLQALTQDDAGATASFATPGGQRDLRARFVVGCDGGRSTVRRLIGAGIEDLGFHEPWLIADFVNHRPEADPDRNTYQYCGGERAGSKVFVGAGRKRWEFRLNPGDDPATIGTPEAVWPMVARWITPADARLERTAVYTFHSTITRQWRRGRVFLAGDAAHQTPPFMGQGMCAGLRDAANLGWKLAAVCAGAGGALLDSYQTERLPHVRAYIELTMQMGRLINETAAAIDNPNVSVADGGPQALSQIRPRLGPGLGHGPHRGEMFPQPCITGQPLRDDRLGPGWALVVDGDAPDIGSARVAVEAGPDAITRAWMRDRGAVAALLRPDRYVFATAGSRDEIAALLAAVP